MAVAQYFGWVHDRLRKLRTALADLESPEAPPLGSEAPPKGGAPSEEAARAEAASGSDAAAGAGAQPSPALVAKGAVVAKLLYQVPK